MNNEQVAFPPAAPAHINNIEEDGVDGVQEGWENHEMYYFEDGNVTFLVCRVCFIQPEWYSYFHQVENTLYRLHRSFFEQNSEIFADMFTVEPAEGEDPEGTTDDIPITLADQSKDDFDRFLSFIYPLCVFYLVSAMICTDISCSEGSF